MRINVHHNWLDGLPMISLYAESEEDKRTLELVIKSFHGSEFELELSHAGFVTGENWDSAGLRVVRKKERSINEIVWVVGRL